METKVCKICGVEKPVSEFMSQKQKCRVCNWKEKNKERYVVKDNWSLYEYDIILDYILNQRCEFINDILEYLNNKTIDELAVIIGGHLNIRGGNYKIRLLKECPTCGKQIELTPQRVRRTTDNYCSNECMLNNLNKDNYKIQYKCVNCGKDCECTPSHYKKSENHFCSHSCADSYNAEKRKNRVLLTCEYCNDEYEVVKYKENTSRFCSNKCKAGWQSTDENKGLKNPTFASILTTCDWCGEEYYEKPSRFKNNNQKHFFCSKHCRQEWFSKDYSQTEENKKFHQKKAVDMLESGFMNKTNTGCQIVVNNLLDDLNVKYKNEKGFKICTVDNFLIDNNLIIEVMGTYWHTDNRFYDEIKYEMQVNRIKQDKSKHTYIKNKYNIEILYLWEYDVLNNSEMCKQLINKYIKTNGVLENYHSFNYQIKNNKPFINKKILTPYMEWKKTDLSNIINLSLKEKTCKKQVDKWIVFNCDVCGQEKEELISKFSKKKSHYCSNECRSIGLRKRHITYCNYCGTEKQVQIKALKNNNAHYCDRNCYLKYMKNKEVM